ncbi:MAG: PAS domain S-box protein [Burkholderiales bacterium]|nr:PAS domain S-box protein [Bacteroidia bacterium]
MNRQSEILKKILWVKLFITCLFLLLCFINGGSLRNLFTLVPVVADLYVLYLLKENKIKIAAYFELLLLLLSIFLIDAGFRSDTGTWLYYLPLIIVVNLFDAAGSIRIKYVASGGVLLSLLLVNYLHLSPQYIHTYLGTVIGPANVFYLNLFLVFLSSVYLLQYFSNLHQELNTAFKVNQTNYNSLIENTYEQVWLVDTRFNLIFYNHGYHKVFLALFKKEPVQGGNVLTIVLGTPQYDKWRNYYERAFKGESFLMDEAYKYPEGIRHFEFSFRPVYKDQIATGAIVTSKDITSHKQQLIDERFYSENLQLLLGSTEDIIFELNEEGKCCRVWHAENMNLFDPLSHFIGKSVEELFDIPFHTNISPAYQEVANTGVPQRFEYHSTHLGKTIHSVVKLRRIKNSSPPRVSIVLEDVTRQKEAEIKQDQQSLFLNKLIDHLPLGLFVKNVKHNLSYTLWNTELEKLFALKQEDVLGKTDQEIFHQLGEIENYLATDNMVLETKEPLLIEKLNIQVGNTQVIARTFKIPILNSLGEVEQIIGILENITDVVKAQQELEMSGKRWNYALSGSRDAVWDINLVTSETFYSPIFNEMLGYLDSEFVKSEWEELVHPDDLKEAWQKFTRHIAGETPYFECEYRLRKKDNTYIWVLDRGKIAESDDDGTATRVIGTFSDITYRKNLEQQYLNALQKAEESSKAKSMFLSIMSHEIRTPMNGVIGIINLLLSDEPKPAQMENLSALKFSADHLMFLLNDILDFSKIDADKLLIEESCFNLISLLKNSMKPLVPLAKQKGLNLKLNISQNMPEALFSDPLRLGQIFSNLLSNAIKFTPSGNILVEAIVQEKGEDYVNICFSFTDSGIGIDKDYLPLIFEEFTQASTDTTRKYGGTGLGLAISKRLVKKLGGDLQVQNNKEEGTKFWFNLNIRIDKTQQTEFTSGVDKVTKKPLKGMNILLVEDNKINVFVANKFLTRWGIETDVANNGKEALSCVLNKKYDLILMDLQMPEMDGFEAALTIRKTGVQTPIYALTANVLAEVKQQVTESGMDDYISKPFNPDDLYEKISKHYTPPKQNYEALDLFSK